MKRGGEGEEEGLDIDNVHATAMPGAAHMSVFVNARGVPTDCLSVTERTESILNTTQLWLPRDRNRSDR